MNYDYGRTAVKNYPCRGSGTGLGWITPNGRFHRTMKSHAEWAEKFFSPMFEGDPYGAAESLLKSGWIRVVNSTIWDIGVRPKRAALETCVEMMIHCATKYGWNPEYANLLVEWPHGKLHRWSPAEFAKKLSGRGAVDRLFAALYPGVMASYDRR